MGMAGTVSPIVPTPFIPYLLAHVPDSSKLLFYSNSPYCRETAYPMKGQREREGNIYPAPSNLANFCL